MRMLTLRALFIATLPLVAGVSACSSSGSTAGTSTVSGGATSSTTDATASGSGGAGGDASTSAGSTGAGTGGSGGGVVADPPGIFVAVGDGGRRLRSKDDGVTWTDDVSIAPDGGDDFVGLRTVAWGNGLFVAAGWRIMTSPDGATWKDTPPDMFKQNWMGQMAYGAGSFVGLGGYGSRVTSPDAVTWTQHSIDTNASHAQGGIAFAKGKGFVSVNDSGDLSQSPDGVIWAYTMTNIGAAAHLVAYGNGYFVAIGDKGIYTSSEGTAWSGPAPFLTMDLRAMVFGQGHFTVISPEHVYTSVDGASWLDTAVKGLFVYHAAFGHGTYVAFDVTRVRRSTDGLVWSDPVELGGKNAIQRAAFGPQ